MKRRAFVQLVAASMATPLVPAQLLQAASFLEPLDYLGSREFSPIVWHEEWQDYDNIYCLSAEFPDGRRYASSMIMRPKELTEEIRNFMKRSLITWWRDNQ